MVPLSQLILTLKLILGYEVTIEKSSKRSGFTKYVIPSDLDYGSTLIGILAQFMVIFNT